MTSNGESGTATGGGAFALPMVVARDTGRVKRSFWKKLRNVAGQIPFAEDTVAMYFCATDPRTPLKVRATLLGALLYFIMPADLVPDFIAGLGYTDDASVIAGAIALVARHITPGHRARARAALAEDGAGGGRDPLA